MERWFSEPEGLPCATIRNGLGRGPPSGHAEESRKARTVVSPGLGGGWVEIPGQWGVLANGSVPRPDPKGDLRPRLEPHMRSPVTESIQVCRPDQDSQQPVTKPWSLVQIVLSPSSSNKMRRGSVPRLQIFHCEDLGWFYDHEPVGNQDPREQGRGEKRVSTPLYLGGRSPVRLKGLRTMWRIHPITFYGCNLPHLSCVAGTGAGNPAGWIYEKNRPVTNGTRNQYGKACVARVYRIRE
ncbi:hypothetical protein DFS33DRAFT_1275464 [Desarmillaria ectypa]|nr:hypothetical protein DFS33DRAFT_1275464 [Desarmillaria ectypa]